ncbi:MAG: MBL fold metallo-hydrolase [Marinilabiliaceae bacterium]|nr:MBL fold metallo-hydrolase [Marinilabiliaceae bacterium]
MKLELCAIASGSNGNCYYIGTSDSAILIDAGISQRSLLFRMAEKNLNPEKIKAIFISHEHRDHINGARVISNKNKINIYMTDETWKRSIRLYRPKNFLIFQPGDVITVDNFTIHSFLKKHNAVEPCSFRIEYKDINIGIFTDLGTPCENVINQFSKCQVLFLECNYDENLLWNGRYPLFLKRRIDSEIGHLSNNQALKLIKEHRNPDLKLLFLSHLSEENNNPEIALATFEEFKNCFDIVLTNRNGVGEVYNYSISG